MTNQLLEFIDPMDDSGASSRSVLVVEISRKADAIDRDDAAEKEFTAAVVEYYRPRGIVVEVVNADALQAMWDNLNYDIIYMRGVLQRQKEVFFAPRKLLLLLRRHLRSNGRIICIEKNRMALSVMGGEPQNKFRPYEPVSFDGDGPGFLRSELRELFSRSGYTDIYFMYPLPRSEEVSELYSDHHSPSADGRRPALKAVIREDVFPCFSEDFFVEARREPVSGPRCIFCSFRTNRRNPYRSVRKIILTQDGRAYEAEEPVSGNEYVGKKKERLEKLLNYYHGFALEINPFEYEEGILLSSYTDGRRLSDVLDDFAFSGNIEGFYMQLRRYMDTLLSPERLKIQKGGGAHGAPFGLDGGFMKFFGGLSKWDEKILSDEYAPRISVIGLRFRDLITEGRGFTLTGADFTADFPVPFSYLLYYPLEDYFSADKLRPSEWRADIYKRFNISADKLKLFDRMRRSFLTEAYMMASSRNSEEEYLCGRVPAGDDSIRALDVSKKPGILEIKYAISDKGRDWMDHIRVYPDLKINDKYYFSKKPVQIVVDTKKAKNWVEVQYNFIEVPSALREEMKSLIEIASEKHPGEEPKKRFSIFG